MQILLHVLYDRICTFKSIAVLSLMTTFFFISWCWCFFLSWYCINVKRTPDVRGQSNACCRGEQSAETLIVRLLL